MTNDHEPRIEITQNGPVRFSSVWLKYVESVDLDVHCINSLIGPRERGIDRRAHHQILSLAQYRQPLAWYLCAVTYPYRWEQNVHVLAFPNPGHEETVTHSGMTVSLINASSAPITDEWIDPNDRNANVRRFRTCRNWQAAWMLHRRLGAVNETNPDRRRFAKPAKKKKSTYDVPLF